MSLKDVFSIVYVGRLMIAKSAALSAISFPLISTCEEPYTNSIFFFFCLSISFLCDLYELIFNTNLNSFYTNKRVRVVRSYVSCTIGVPEWVQLDSPVLSNHTGLFAANRSGLFHCFPGLSQV